MKLKICGMTNSNDISNVIALGINAIGFIFVESSPRCVSSDLVEELTYNIPPFVSTVGVFANSDIDQVNQIVKKCRLDYIQLHGDEDPSYCMKLDRKVIKAFRVATPDDLDCISQYQGGVSSILLDTKVKDTLGGTGQTFDWGIALQAKQFDIPMILSGGINSSNIKKAINVVNPYAIDISSGVEESPGKKDYNKLKEVVTIARENYF